MCGEIDFHTDLVTTKKGISEKIAAFWIDYSSHYKNWNMIHERLVPRKVLESFVTRIFRINRVTLIKHMKELIREGLVNEIRIPIKGNYFGYSVNPDFLRQPLKYFRYSKKDQMLFEAERKSIEWSDILKKYDQHIYPSKFTGILSDVLEELEDYKPGAFKAASSLDVGQVFAKYPFIRRGLEIYICRRIRRFSEYNVNEVLQLSDEHEKRIRLAEIFGNLYNEAAVGAVTEFRNDLIESSICMDCLLSYKPLSEGSTRMGEMIFWLSLDYENNSRFYCGGDNPVVYLVVKEGDRFGTCPICGCTVEVPQKLQTPMATSTEQIPKPFTKAAVLHRCKKCDAYVPPLNKRCPDCGSHELRKVQDWEIDFRYRQPKKELTDAEKEEILKLIGKALKQPTKK